jgi:predicted ArsR family transcriptional regulator
MNQLDLLDFTRTHARTTDPQTSHDAAKSAVGLAAAHRAKILGYLKSISPSGAIYQDIASAVGLEPHAVARRLPELQQAGLARPLDATAVTRSGRQARLWAAA